MSQEGAAVLIQENMMKMLIILVFICGLCEICGVVESFGNTYRVKENDTITIQWEIGMKSNVTLINMICEFYSDTVKTLYEMIRGVLVFQSQQFAGRVHFDEDAPKEAKIRLRLSRVTARDSGNYTCYLAANYDTKSMRRLIEMSERFVLTVTNRDEWNTPGSKTTTGSLHPPGEPEPGLGWRMWIILALGAGALVAFVFLFIFCKARRKMASFCPLIT